MEGVYLTNHSSIEINVWKEEHKAIRHTNMNITTSPWFTGATHNNETILGGQLY